MRMYIRVQSYCHFCGKEIELAIAVMKTVINNNPLCTHPKAFRTQYEKTFPPYEIMTRRPQYNYALKLFRQYHIEKGLDGMIMDGMIKAIQEME
jgi:hypothetical protein